MAGNARVKIFSVFWTTLWKDMFYKDKYYTGVCCGLQSGMSLFRVNSYCALKRKMMEMNWSTLQKIKKEISQGMETSVITC